MQERVSSRALSDDEMLARCSSEKKTQGRRPAERAGHKDEWPFCLPVSLPRCSRFR